MSEEIGQAIQIIRVCYDGIELAMKIGTDTLAQVKKVMDFLCALLEYEKTIGKTDMRKLLLKGGDLQVLQFDLKDRKQVEKMAKKYGILYSVLPDINKEDGMGEIIFHTEAVPRVNMMLQKLKEGKLATFDEYLENGTEEELDRVLSLLDSEKKGNGHLHTAEDSIVNEALEGLMEKAGAYAVKKQSVSVEEIQDTFKTTRKEAEALVDRLERIGVLDKEDNGQHKVVMDKEAFFNRMKSYRELADRIKSVSASQDKNLVDITITKKLIKEENDHAVKTRVPGMYGDNARYIWINKLNVMDIHDGKTILTFLDVDKEYKLYSEDNRVVEIVKGKDLYDRHYDRVESEVRKRYNQVRKNSSPVIIAQKISTPKKR